MIEDPSKRQQQPDKLVLPAAPTEAYSAPEYLVRAEQRKPVQIGRLIRKNQTLPDGPLPDKLIYLWHKDPAHKVLFIAIGFVLATSIVCASLLAGFVMQPSPAPVANLPSRPAQMPTTTIVPTAEIAATPTTAVVPTPTPIPTSTPIIAVTSTPVMTGPVIIQPTPNPTDKLTVKIGAIPAQINNNTTVPLTINTNKPGATISLLVSYTAIPFLYTSNPQIADNNGNATFVWNIHEHTFSPFTKTVTATITAIAQYRTGQQTNSQTTTVHILMK